MQEFIYPYGQDPYGYDRQNQKLIQDVGKSIQDEFNAIHYYTRLAELTTNPEFKKSILGVRQDEIKHFGRFSRIYTELTGKYYPLLTLHPALPSSFHQGIRESIRDEQETVPFYKSIAARLSNQKQKKLVLQAANDEARHFNIFSNINSYLR